MNIIKVGRQGQISIRRNIRRTLKDFRGSTPVSEPQDFNTIRQEVINRQYYRTTDS